MKYPENIQETARLLPDYMGFIFYEKSPRFFDGILPEIPEDIEKVGVFVNAGLDDILEKIKKYGLQLVQLHGNETPAFCDLLQHINVKIIKAFSVDDTFDFETIAPYENVCDYFLFDAKGKNHGGNGVTFNWRLLKNYPSGKPFFLSGGIGLEELSSIKKQRLPIYAVDINSKFETAPGLKNIQQLKKIHHEISR